ncbi:unnamed protein product [Durusdinium trenchii]|uniref:Hyaluronan-mediated motility receptor C-terminal domain-containing protein n=2 Tax=Durusdinium trenchii TaxID=1381693 RepID=A0ABP0N2I2_9DINO
MMWSKQKSPRFAADKPGNPIGPGYYDLPSLLDEHSVTIAASSERFQEQMAGDTPGPGSYVAQAPSRKCKACKDCKENRPPSREKGSKLGPKEVNQEELQQRLREEERGRAQAEQRVAQLTASAQSVAAEFAELRGRHFTLSEAQEASQATIKDLRQSLANAEEKVPELKRQLAEVEANHRALKIQHECDAAKLEEAQEAWKATAAEHQSEVDVLRAEASQVPELKRKLQQLQEEHQREAEILRAEVPELKKKIEQIQEEHEREAEVLRAEASQVPELKNQLERIQEEHQREAEVLGTEASQVPELQKKIIEIQAASSAASEEHERQVEALQKEASQVPALKKELDEIKAACSVAMASVEERAQEVKELGEKLAAAEAQGVQHLEDLAAARAGGAEVKQLQEELTAARAEVADLVTEKEQMKIDLEKLRFAEINANMSKNAKERAEAQLRETKQDVDHWRSKAQSMIREDEKIKRQEEDVDRLEREVKELHEQNTQLLTTFQQFKSEWEVMRAENQSLQETLAMSEMSLDRASEEKAQIMGHVNPKQKIRHMVNLKEENKELREQLKKAKNRITQLGVSRKGEGLLEALACFSHGRGLGTDQLSIASACPDTPAPCSVRGEARTPKRPTTPTRKPSASRGGGTRSSQQEEEYQAWLAEEERRRQMQDRAVERVQTDFQHFIALIERAVLSGEAESPNPAALLERLRSVVCPGDVAADGSAAGP